MSEGRKPKAYSNLFKETRIECPIFWWNTLWEKILLIFLDESSVPKCSAGYELSQDGKACYKLHIEPSTVEEAEKTCKKEGGDLASVSSQ